MPRTYTMWPYASVYYIITPSQVTQSFFEPASKNVPYAPLVPAPGLPPDLNVTPVGSALLVVYTLNARNCKAGWDGNIDK